LIVRALKLAYGGACYLVFLAAFLYAIAFVGDLPVVKTIDSGAGGPLWSSLAIDAVLLGVFAVQHSLMARPAFKRWWTRLVSADIERSTYVLLSSLALGLIFWQWRAAAGVVWRLDGAAAAAVAVLFWIGWLVVLASTFMLSHFELFGLSQVWAALRRRSTPPPTMRTPLLYGFVRHPIMLGFVIAFWSAPTMTVGRLFFAVSTTLYILIALQLEERDLVVLFGDAYRAYRERTPMLAPFTKWSRRPSSGAPVARPDRG
jgi:protein-S-isoprenylcysteine O-methyltransferase Ste14